MCRNESKGITSLIVLAAVGLYVAAVVTRRWAKVTDINGVAQTDDIYVDIWEGDDGDGRDMCTDSDSRLCQGVMATRGFVLLALLISVIALAAMNWNMKFAAFLLVLAGACGIICCAAFRGIIMEKLADGDASAVPPVLPQSTDLWYSTGIAVAGLLMNFIASFLACGYQGGTTA